MLFFPKCLETIFKKKKKRNCPSHLHPLRRLHIPNLHAQLLCRPREHLLCAAQDQQLGLDLVQGALLLLELVQLATNLGLLDAELL